MQIYEIFVIMQLIFVNPISQSCYLIGGYNKDLLKYSTHNPTSEYFYLMFFNSFTPLINKTTRILG